MFLDVLVHIFTTLFGTILFIVFIYKGSGFLLRIPFFLLGKADWFDKIWSKPMNFIGIKGTIDYKTKRHASKVYTPNMASDPRYSFKSWNTFNTNRSY